MILGNSEKNYSIIRNRLPGKQENPVLLALFKGKEAMYWITSFPD